MDKKSISIGIICLFGGFLLMLYNGTQMDRTVQQRSSTPAEPAPATQEPGTAAPEAAWQRSEVAPANRENPDISDALQRLEVPVPTNERAEARRVTIENKDVRVVLTTHGGAIERVILRNYTELHPKVDLEKRPVVLNDIAGNPALDLQIQSSGRLIPIAGIYTLVESGPQYAVFRAELTGGLTVERRYEVQEVADRDDPEAFIVRHSTRFINATDAMLGLNNVFLNLGTAAPSAADHMGFNLNASYLRDGDYKSIAASKFSGGGFIFKSEPKELIERRGLMQWGAVKNQFFVSIFTPDAAAEAIVARGIKFPRDPVSGKIPTGVTADLEFAVEAIMPGEANELSGRYYVGPKNFDRLSKMDLAQEDVMQLGWFLGMFLGIIGFVAKMLLTLMGGIQGLVGNWGFAIILTTLVIRLLLWPLTAKAARASKRMQKLSKPLQEIREKYKDNPQKLNQEMMTLWKKHKISPLSGCWPVLVQLPIFIAFFNLLRNSSDLRFAEFLWVRDLSMPDATIAFPEGTSIPFVGTAINVLPFVWLVSMYFQVKMMPTPSVDNAQVKIMKWMPFIFFPFTYYFSSGLVLYWTTTNGFSIFQQWMTNRTRDDEDVAIDEEIADMENPSRKKLKGPLISKKKKKKPGDQPRR